MTNPNIPSEIADATPAPAPVQADRLIAAMANIDWVQFTMNGGGCFHLDPDGSLCGRAIRWPGHQSDDADHLFVPLHVAATQLARYAPAPVRISPEVLETILEALRRFKGDDLERAVHAFGRDPKGANANYIDRLKASRAKIESAIAFVEALP